MVKNDFVLLKTQVQFAEPTFSSSPATVTSVSRAPVPSLSLVHTGEYTTALACTQTHTKKESEG